MSVIVVNWNVRADLERCLRSLPNQSPSEDVEVIVVDNGSSDGSLEMLEGEFPGVRVIANGRNIGFAAASNQGLRAATGDILFLLNPDTWLCDGALSSIRSRMESDSSIGVVAPKLLNEDGTVQSSRRRFPTAGTAFIDSTPLQRFMPNHHLLRRYYMNDKPDDRIHDVDWAVGACLAVRRKAVESAGYLDESFLMYSEEMDWCRRIKQSGWRIVYEPAAKVVHYGGKSADQDVLSRHLLFQSSKVRFYRKHFGPAFGALLRVYLLGCYACQSATEIVKLAAGHKPVLRKKRLAMYGHILRSGLRPRLPESSQLYGSSAPKVLVISAEYPPKRGGVGDYTRCLVSELAKRDIHVRVLTSPAARDSHMVTGHTGQTVDRSVEHWNFSCWKAAMAAIRDFKPDVIHVQYQTGAYGMHPAINLLPSLVRALEVAPKSVVTFHDLLLPYLFPKAGRIRELANRALCRGADHLIVTNEEDLASLPGFCAGKSSLIPIGSNIPLDPPKGFTRALWRKRLGIADEEFVVAYFGFLTESKGIADLVNALGRLPLHQPDLPFKLLIIGSGSGDSDVMHENCEGMIRKAVEQLGLADRVIWTGYASNEEVSAHLLSADIAVLPYHDGASMRRGTLMAALAHRLPVITTSPAKGLCGDWLADEVNVMLIPPRSPEALAAAILRLAGDTEKQSRLREGAGALAARVEWERIGQEHALLYSALADRRRQNGF